jgi:hypothetical protein
MNQLSNQIISGVLITLLSQPAPSASSQPLSKKEAALRLKTPEYLPEAARDLLRERMERHGDSMMMLMATVLMLNFQATEQLATNIATEPRLVRPLRGDTDSLNTRLPTKFFDLQDQLVQRARTVAKAAKSRNEGQVVKAYGSLAETCVACHSTYFRGPPPEEN